MLYEVNNLTFSYSGSHGQQLRDISFQVEQGAFVLLAGPSGSGKTTLLRHLKKEVIPKGTMSGQVQYQEMDMTKIDSKRSIQEIGMVFQNPEDQLVMDTVINELTFAMENIGLNAHEMKLRLAETVTYFGLEHLLHHQVDTLSGGQKQLINLCSVLLLRPQVLIFDEPTVELDPIARKEFLQMVHQLNRDLNITIIMSEHLLDDVLHFANRMLYLSDGRLIHDVTPKQFCQQLDVHDSDLRMYLPEIVQLSNLLELEEYVPLTVKEAKQALKSHQLIRKREQMLVRERPVNHEVLMALKHGYFRYDQQKFVLKEINLKLYNDEIIGILGANGSGKSTLLKCLTGHMKGMKGRLTFKKQRVKAGNMDDFKGRIGYVSQYTKVHFSRQRVREELDFVFDQNQLQWQQELLTLFKLDHLMDQHPYDLSGGEMEKLAIVLAMANKPDVLLLDEPTKGLDPISKQQLGKILVRLVGMGTSIILVTHDTSFVAKYTNRAVLLFDGEVVYDGDARLFLKSNHYYTTMTNLVMKSIHNDCLTVEDVRYYYKW